jgi:hypothetical protein
MSYLKYDMDYLINGIMEGITLDEVGALPPMSCAAKYTCIAAGTLAGIFAEEIFNDPEARFGKYVIALQRRIEVLTGGLRPKAFDGLNDLQWDLLKKKSIELGEYKAEDFSNGRA